MPEDGPTKLWKSFTKNNITINKIKARLREKDVRREIFLSIAKLEPVIAHQVMEDNGCSHTEFYNHIPVLIKLGIVGRLPVMDIKNPKNWLEKEALKKWEYWSERMPKGTKSRYHANTGLYYITKLGNSDDIMDFVCRIDGIKEVSGRRIGDYDKDICSICKKKKEKIFSPVKKNKDFKICEECFKSMSRNDVSKLIKRK